LGEHNVRLEYNKDYTIKIIDDGGKESSTTYRYDQENVTFNFNIYSDMSDCESDSYKGYIRIYGNLDPGSRVRFVSGPQTPVHEDVEIEEYTYFYPFSQDYRYSEHVPIAEGEYVFEVTDKCGDLHTLTVSHKKHLEVEGFSYIIDDVSDVCVGITRLYPQGKIYNNGNLSSTYFFIENGPDPGLNGTTIYEGEYFSLSKPGEYTIGVKDWWWGCAIKTIVFKNEFKTFGLEGRSSYVCDEGSTGRISVRANNGKPPYTYTLLNEDLTPVEGIASNNTGDFEYGAFGEKYVVKIQDACDNPKSFNVSIQINTIDPTALISGKTHICKGETLELYSLLLGATEYKWSGPLDFSANTRNVVIPDATSDHSGEYTLEVKPAGCDKFFSSKIVITVHDTPVPEIEDFIELCQAETTTRLEAKPLNENYSIQWYDENDELLTEAPIIDLNDEIKNHVFYVMQTDDIYSCVSEKKKVEVKINPLPEKNANAVGWSCANEQPNIVVTDIVAGYVYTVFSDADATDQIMTFTGTEETMNITMPVTVTDNVTFYLKTATSVGCALSPDIVEFQVSVDKLEISPAALSIYAHEVPYSVQLTSNAEEPVFSYTGNLVTGIEMTSDGLISGTVPESAGRVESTFIVTVTDKNGCQTDNEYLLRTCEPAPDLMYDTVIYCQGMQAHPLQASSPNGNILKWYDSELNPLSETPVPNTNVIGTQTFYVSQINEVLQCEGKKAQVTVLVSPAPVAANLKVSVDNVCFGNSPSILLEDIEEKFIYSIYSDNTFSNKLYSLTGVTSGIVNLEDVLEDNTIYCILVIDSLGCTSIDRQDVPVEVIKLYIEPEKLPQYRKNVEYEQILRTNAQSPVFTLTEGNLPDGLSLNASGTIFGKVPNSEHSIQNTFTVKVQDLNGCSTTREYVLHGDVFVPKIFTPNGDGVNDIFMQEYKVVILDRLGIEIFRGDNGWDGTYKGKPVASDIYFYKLEYVDEAGHTKILTGYVGVHY
jgi:gliding motility-associated-like protein